LPNPQAALFSTLFGGDGVFDNPVLIIFFSSNKKNAFRFEFNHESGYEKQGESKFLEFFLAFRDFGAKFE
jgi:hypothetical protein